LIHDALYTYYRLGLDQLTQNEEEARNGVVNALNYLTTLNKDQPNSMIIQVFFQGKSNELSKLFSKGSAETKVRARDMLVKLDLTNASVYKDIK
jgi:hypothetical protein